jgi:hypothetical protein
VIALPSDLLSDFRRKLSAFFAVEAGDKALAWRPRLGLTLVVPGEPEVILEIRLGRCRWFKKLDTETLAGDLLVNRTLREDLSQRTSHRPVALGFKLTPDGARIDRRSLIYGDEGQERIAEVVADFLAGPMASLSRSKNRCCLCRRNLTDGTSVLRGYGPECSKKIRTLLGFFSGEHDGIGDAAAPIWDFESILSHPGEPSDNDDDWQVRELRTWGSGSKIPFVPGTGLGDESNSSRDVLEAEPEVEQPDPLDQYFDPEAGAWWVESHPGQVCFGLPWNAQAPLDVVLDDAADTISGCIEDGITDDNDNPITDYHSFVLWKGAEVAAVATEAATDPSRLEFTRFRV